MRFFQFILPRLAPVVLVATVALTGCAFSAVFKAKAPAALAVTTISIDAPGGPNRFTVEIAADDASREKGLMFRKTMAPDAGMLFDFHSPQFTSFWMKNTYIPLDLLFVKADGTISSIAPNAVPFSTASIRSVEPVQVVIELNGGRAQQLGIIAGKRVHSAVFGSH